MTNLETLKPCKGAHEVHVRIPRRAQADLRAFY
jgi:hypothetical protein